MLASAVQVPWRTASSVGFRPAAPTMAAITQSAGRLAASSSASPPAPTSMPVPASASRKFLEAGLIGDHRELGAMLDRELGETRGILQPVSATTCRHEGSRPIRSSVLSPIEPVAPRTEMRRGACFAGLDLDGGLM